MNHETDTRAAAAARLEPGPGLLLVAAVLCVYGGLALTVDFPRAAIGIQSDEATYYMMGHSLAEDGDLVYRREDLARVWREFPAGPAGLFLKKGRDIIDAGPMLRPPFFWTRTEPDPDGSRLYYGKSFIYPLCAAPFVRVFGTNGFLVLHALLLGMVVWCSYLFLHARMRAALAASLAGAFVMASIVPVYFVWITPELFNFSLVLLAYFCWLYKEVASPPSEGAGAGGDADATRAIPGSRWLFRPSSDIAAAVILGLATFSKVPNALLFLPILAWLAWRRRWGRLISAGIVFAICGGGLFLANMAISGEWNYQGGYRKTFAAEFPFQTGTSSFDSKGLLMGRDESLTNIIFDRRVFWTNLAHNLAYFFAGRYSGLIAYFFPAVFAMIAFLSAPRRRPGWQYLVLAAGVGQVLFWIITTPYTWLGGGGSVGNRYFMGPYGIFLFLLPPLSRTWIAVIPWLAGGLFTAQLVLNPFVASFRPGEYASHGPLRALPVELTMVNDLPINTDASKVLQWFGDNPPAHTDPGFQVYFLDDNYFREADKSIWVKGESRAEFLIKYAPVDPARAALERPVRRLMLTLTAGPVDTTVTASVAGHRQRVTIPAEDSRQIAFSLDRGFWYQARAFVWVVSISSSSGFVPLFHNPEAKDTRFLGVRVKPVLVE